MYMIYCFRAACCLPFLSGSLRESSDWCCTECRRERWNTTAQEHIISSPQHHEKMQIHCKHVQTRGPNSLKLSTLTRLFHMQRAASNGWQASFQAWKKNEKRQSSPISKAYILSFGRLLEFLRVSSSAQALYICTFYGKTGPEHRVPSRGSEPYSSAFRPWFSHILPAFLLIDKPLSISSHTLDSIISVSF